MWLVGHVLPVLGSPQGRFALLAQDSDVRLSKISRQHYLDDEADREVRRHNGTLPRSWSGLLWGRTKPGYVAKLWYC